MKPNQNGSPESERKPGRSFSDHGRPLGEELIERADPTSNGAEEGVYGRTSTHANVQHGVADRAKCVAVLRKAEELMFSENPSGDTEEGRQRALELAAGRIGLKIEEYNRLCKDDEEVLSLQAAVFEAARLRACNQPPTS